MIRLAGCVALATGYPCAAALAASARPRIVIAADSRSGAPLAKWLDQQGFELLGPPAEAGSCADPDCFAGLAAARGADYLLRAELGTQAGGRRLTLTLLDRKGQAVSEIAKDLADESPGSFADAVEEAGPKLIQPLRNAGLLTREPAASGSPERPHTASWVLLASGAALLLGSGAVGYAADSANSELDNAVSGSAAGNIPSLRSSVGTEAWISTGLTLAGVAAIVVGVVLLYTGASGAAPTASASASGPAMAWSF